MAEKIDIDAGLVFARSATTLRIPVVDADGAPFTMTGMTLRFTVRRRRTDGDGTSILTRDSGNGITLASDGGTDNVALVTLTAALTNVSEGPYYEYALLRTDAGFEQPLAYGDLHIDATAQP